VPVITRYREQKEELSEVFSIALNGALLLALLLASVCYIVSQRTERNHRRAANKSAGLSGTNQSGIQSAANGV